MAAPAGCDDVGGLAGWLVEQGLKRSFRVLPPSSPFFTLLHVHYPSPGHR